MLAYRHAFHAGNHADVLKHTILVALLRHMSLKDKGYRLVDSHAGAGGYSLEGQYANHRREYEQGVARLWARDDAPPLVADYLQRVRDFNPDGKLRQYPGSPALAQALLRRQDDLRLFELHPTDHKILASFVEGWPAAQVRMADGFEHIKSVLPSPTRRALLLIDPSYELESDYPRTLALAREALARMAGTCVMVWMPQLQALQSVQLPQRLRASAQALAGKGWLLARLSVGQVDERGFGLLGSSVFVFNPPHTLAGQLNQALPWLAQALGRPGIANSWALESSGAP